MSEILKEKIRDLLQSDPRLAILLGEVLGPPVGSPDAPIRPGEGG